MSIDLMEQVAGMEADALDRLKGAEQTGEGTRLPFPALYTYVINGDIKLKTAGGVQYFGGFATDADKAGEMVEAGELVAYPKDWAAFTGEGQGGSYNSLGSRVLTFCPIKSRQSWVNQDGKSRRPDYSEATGHKRRHIQYLGQMRDAAGLVTPVVITAKGFQGNALLDAVVKWGKAINPFLKELNATRFPLGAFWLTVGTKGDAPNFVKVGKGAQSSITPIDALIPEKLTAEMVAKRFIGPLVMGQSAELLSQADEWLAAWKSTENAEAPAAGNGHAANGPAWDEFGQA